MTLPSSHLRLVEPPAGADERFTHNRPSRKKRLWVLMDDGFRENLLLPV